MLGFVPASLAFQAAFNSRNCQRLSGMPKLSERPELSKADWNAKDAGTNPSIEWSIAAKTSPYKPGAKSCNLCLAEKLAIPQSNLATTINKRSELNCKFRYKNKFNLKSFIA